MKTFILSDAQRALLVAELIGIDRSKRTREQGVDLDHLIDAIQTPPDVAAMSAAAAEAGVTLGALAKAAGEPIETSCFATAACAIGNRRGFSGDDVSFDDHAVVSRSSAGAHVSAWVWVSNSDAGIPGVPVGIIDEVVEHLQSCETDLFSIGHPVHEDQIQFVSDFFSAHYVEIERLHMTGLKVEPLVSRMVFDGEIVDKKLTTVIQEVALAAKATGYSVTNLVTLALWLQECGNELDRELVYTAPGLCPF